MLLEIFKFAVRTCFIVDTTCKIRNKEGIHKWKRKLIFSDCVLWINLIKLFIKRVCKNINFVSL